MSRKIRTTSFPQSLVIRVEAFADLDSPNLTLSELCAIKLGTYNKRLCKAVEEAKDHVRTCEVRT